MHQSVNKRASGFRTTRLGGGWGTRVGIDLVGSFPSLLASLGCLVEPFHPPSHSTPPSLTLYSTLPHTPPQPPSHSSSSPPPFLCFDPACFSRQCSPDNRQWQVKLVHSFQHFFLSNLHVAYFCLFPKVLKSIDWCSLLFFVGDFSLPFFYYLVCSIVFVLL